MRIYGRYIGRVRHSILRRPYVILERLGTPTVVRIFTSFDALLRLPSYINELLSYDKVDVVKGSVIDERTITAANIHTPSHPHLPLCLYYTPNGICDYLTTIINASVYLPDSRIYDYTEIDVDVKRQPGAHETTSILALLKKLPSVVVTTKYLLKLARQSIIIPVIEWVARIHRPYPIIEIIGQDAELVALPKYSEGTEITAEIIYRGYNELKLKSFYLISGEALTVFNNINVLTPVNTTAQYIPQTAMVHIDFSVNNKLEIIPTVTLVSAPNKLTEIAISLPKLFVNTSTAYTAYPYKLLIGRFASDALPIITYSNVLLNTENSAKAKYTYENVHLDTTTQVLATLERLLRGTHEKEYSITTYLPNILLTSNTAVSRRPHIVLVSRPTLYYLIEAMYAPIVILDYERVLALHTPQNIIRINESKMYVYPYFVMRSNYYLSPQLLLTMIVYGKIHELTTDSITTFRVGANTFATSFSAYYRLPYNVLKGIYAVLPLPVLFLKNADVISYDGYTFYLDVYKMLKGVLIPSASIELSRVANVVYLSTTTALELIKPALVTAETLTSLTYATVIKTLTASTVSTTAEYKYAVPLYLNFSASSAVSAIKPYLIGLNSTPDTKASVSRAIITTPQNVVKSAHELANLIYTAYASLSASHLTSNILSSTYGLYSLQLLAENVKHYLYSNYTVSAEKYAILSATYGAWRIDVIGTNVSHRTDGSVEIDVIANNVTHRTDSSYSITPVRNNVISANYAAYTLSLTRNNITSSLSSNYTLIVYKTATLTGSVVADSQYSIWRIATLRGSVSSESKYALKATKSAIDVLVDVAIDTSEYIRY